MVRIEKKSIGTINEEDGESDEITNNSTAKKVKLDDYKSMSFGEKDEIIQRFNAPPPPPPKGVPLPPPLPSLPAIGVINLVK